MTVDKTSATLATAKHGGCVQLGTPGSRWASTGGPDPHGNRYDCERAALAMGDLSDDELANAVFMHGDRRLSFGDAGGELPGSAYLTAAKDRIRWLSRALAAAQAEKVAQPSPGGLGALNYERMFVDACSALAEVSRELGCDPEQGGAEPILAAIAELRAAQPSPAGQGDARSQFEEYRGGDCERDAQGYYTNARTAQDWAMWQAALAARQPVGEPVANPIHQLRKADGSWVDQDKHSYDYNVAQGHRADLRVVYAAPPAQAVDLGQFRVAVYCMQNYTGVLPRKYWDKGSKAFDAEATRLMTVVDGAGVARG